MIYCIEFGADYIAIYQKEKEVLYWHIDEWISDPQVVFSICNAIMLAAKKPSKLNRILIKRDSRSTTRGEENAILKPKSR